MRSILLLNCALLVGVAACELKITPGDSDSSDDSTGAATTGESDSGGTTTGGSGQSTNGGSSSATDATTATATSATSTTTEGTTGMTSSTTSATSLTDATTVSTGDPIEPTPCAGEAKAIPGEAIAYLMSQVPPNPDTTGGGSSGTSGGEPPDPATLHVRLSSQAFTCADPAANLTCGPNWEVSFAIPPEFQTPGLYHLSGPQIFGLGTETGADQGGGDCSFGGGSFFATLEIVDIDAEVVTGRLCHIDAPIPFNAAELEGAFVAPRCP